MAKQASFAISDIAAGFSCSARRAAAAAIKVGFAEIRVLQPVDAMLDRGNDAALASGPGRRRELELGHAAR